MSRVTFVGRPEAVLRDDPVAQLSDAADLGLDQRAAGKVARRPLAMPDAGVPVEITSSGCGVTIVDT